MVGRVRLNNNNIPTECHVNNTWRSSFIPTLLSWVSVLPDPWNLDDEALRNTLTMTADRLYDNLDLGLDDDSVDSETQ